MDFPPDVETEGSARPVHRDSLLEKFDIPVAHLDFPYVETCTDSKELERIFQILQSGEEGYYPELLAATEERLRKIKPSSRFIRKLTPVVNKSSLDQDTRKELHIEMVDFLENVSMQNAELHKFKQTGGCTSDIPQVRENCVVSAGNAKKPEGKPNRIKATDYSSWDKYDADTELLKMDLETEQMQKKHTRTADDEYKATNTDIKQVPIFLTKTEATLEANQERLKGNEYYRSRDYKEALDCYTNSINVQPTLEGYNNRAQVYLMLKNYQLALEDGKSALKFDTNNVKANMRIAQSLNELHQFPGAMHHLEEIIKIDPNNQNAQNLLNTVRTKYNIAQNSETKNARTRLKITEVSSNDPPKRTQSFPTTKSHKQRRSRRRSSLKQTPSTGSNPVLVPIPGPSHMKEPYYVVLEDNDPETVKRAQYILYNKPQVTYVGQPYETDDDDVTTHSDSCNYKKVTECNAVSREHINIFDEDKKTVTKEDKTAVLSQESAEICSMSALDENCNYEAMDEDFIHITNDMEQCTLTEHCTYGNDSLTTVNNIEVDGKIGGGGEPHMGTNEHDGNRNLEAPFSFLKAWLSAHRDPTYTKQAKLLRNLDENRLVEVIGYKLDGTMLTDIIRTLCSHFTVAHEVERLHTLLVNLTSLPRFNICTLFLSDSDRIKIRNMFEFLEQHGIHAADHIRTAYT